MLLYDEILKTVLPDYTPLRTVGDDGDRDALYLARTAPEIEKLAGAGIPPGHVYADIGALTAEELPIVLGKCRLLAESLEELELLDGIAQAENDAGRLTAVGLRLVPAACDGEQPGIRETELPRLAQARRRLPALSIQGCFVQDCAQGLYGRDLGRYIRGCYELAKRMTVILPCSMPYLGIAGLLEAAARNALEQPETLPEVRRAAETVAMQDRTAFYARLLVT